MPEVVPVDSAQEKPHKVRVVVESLSLVDGVWYVNGRDVHEDGAFTVDELTYKNMLFYDAVQGALRATIGEEVDSLNAALDAVGGDEQALMAVAKKGGAFRNADAKGRRDRKRGA